MTARMLTLRYGFALSIVALLAATILGLAQWAMITAQADASLINQAGRQRMLSQRIALLASRTEAGQSEWRGDLDLAIEEFSQSHDALVTAAEASALTARVYRGGADNLNAQSYAFIQSARLVQASGFHPAPMRDLATRAEALLPRLDDATAAFTEVAERRMSRIRQFEVAAFLATLLVLGLEALLIFRPAAREVARNIDRLTRARQSAERANAAKSRFLARMSQEIRTPLNGVLGMSGALAETKLTADQTRMVQTISASGDLLLAVVNDILDLTRIEAGDIDLEIMDLSVERVVDWTVAAFRPACEEKGLSISAEVAADVQGWYRGDATRIRQLLSNLVSRAVEATERGGIALAARRADVNEAGDPVIEITVSDTGAGRASQPLGETSPDAERGDGGPGLPFCRRLVRLMGGDLNVRSSPGSGTVATVTLPLPEGDPPGPDAVPAGSGDEPPLTLLLVDDVATNRLVMQTMLAKHNATVLQAASGHEALATVSGRKDIDGILMDARMPGMDGLTATRRVRALERQRQTPAIPIILVTSDTDPERMAEYRRAGASQHLTKPVDPRRLSTLLDTLRTGRLQAEPVEAGAGPAAG